MSHYTIAVDGLCQVQPMGQIRPYYGRIVAFRETPGYIYCAGDATGCYPLEKRGGGGCLTSLDPRLYGPQGRDLPGLKKVHRHLLLVRGKYFVVLDDLESARPARYSWLYHVLEDTLKLDPARPGSFTYAADKVSVQVSHIAHAGDLELKHLAGDQVLTNPYTGEDYNKSFREQAHLRRAHALWYTNKTPQGKFHFLTVIYPTKPGAAAPSIRRLDDLSVEVTSGAEKDVITFDPAAGHAASLVVDLPAMTPLPVRE